MSESEADDPTVGPGADPFPEISRRRRRGVTVTSAAAIALGLALSGGAVAGATTASQPPAGSSRPSVPANRPPFGGAMPTAVGAVKLVAGNSFIVTAQDGTTVTVDVGSTTSYFDPGVSSPTLADVKVGEHVAVFGTKTSSTVIATQVAIGSPPAGSKGGPGGNGDSHPGAMPTAVGAVKSVAGNSFIVTAQDGSTVTVDVGSRTAYFDPGVSSPTLADVKVGEHVAVFGTKTSSTVTATQVAIGSPPAGGKGGPGGGATGRPGGPPGWTGGPPSATGVQAP